MKRSYSCPNKNQKHRSSSVKNNKKNVASYNAQFEELRNSYDIFLDVELNKNHFSLRSFAMGGMPYFETSRISYDSDSSNLNNGKKLPQVIQDIIAGKLSPMIKDLFKGINIQGKGIPSFITDSRKSITARYMLTLIDPDNVDNNVASVSHSTEFSKQSIFYSSSSLSENEYCNDSENSYDKRPNNDWIDFKIIHTRKLSDVSSLMNEIEEFTCT